MRGAYSTQSPTPDTIPAAILWQWEDWHGRKTDGPPLDQVGGLQEISSSRRNGDANRFWRRSSFSVSLYIEHARHRQGNVPSRSRRGCRYWDAKGPGKVPLRAYKDSRSCSDAFAKSSRWPSSRTVAAFRCLSAGQTDRNPGRDCEDSCCIGVGCNLTKPNQNPHRPGRDLGRHRPHRQLIEAKRLPQTPLPRASYSSWLGPRR